LQHVLGEIEITAEKPDERRQSPLPLAPEHLFDFSAG
jgi:hypothetical protein